MDTRIKRRISFLLSAALCCSLSAGGCTSGNTADHSATTKTDPDAVTFRGNVEYRENKETDLSAKGAGSLFRNEAMNYTSAEESPQVLKNIRPLSDLKESPKKKQTILVYMVGSDLESNQRQQNASKDIQEMLVSGLDSTDTNVVVYTGGAKTWWNGLPSSKNCYLVYNHPAGAEKASFEIYADEKRNMAAPETLSGFLNTADSLFPADSTSLIFWDHGSGPYMGYGSDENFEPDEDELQSALTMLEMKEAFEASPFKTKKLDLLGFDACLMSSVEIADILSPYANWMVASPELEPGSGWDYSFLQTLNSQPDTQTLGKDIIQSYAESVESMNEQSGEMQNYTLILTDLSKASNTRQAWENFVTAMDAQAQEQGKKFMRPLIDRTWQTMYYGPTRTMELYDAGHLAYQFSDMVPEESQALLDSIGESVAYGMTNYDTCTGLSAYFPSGIQGLNDYKDHPDNEVVLSSSVRSMEGTLASLAEQRGADFNEQLQNVRTINSSGKIELEIPENLRDDVGWIYLTVLNKEAEGGAGESKIAMYHPLVEYIPLQMNENGMVSIDPDPELLVIENKEDDRRLPIRTEYIEERNGVRKYSTVQTSLRTAELDELLNEIVFVQVDLLTDGEDCVVEKITPKPNKIAETGDGGLSADEMNNLADSFNSGRAALSTRGLGAFVSHYGQSVEYRDDKIDKPWFDASGSMSSWETISLKGSTEFRVMNISDLSETQFSYQVVMQDLQNNQYLLATGDYPQESAVITMQTPRGELGFEVKDDHAELTYYHGMDRIVTVPDQVQGKPLTVIRAGAFTETLGEYSSSQDARKCLGEIVLPDTVEEIGADAFRQLWELRKINIPSKVKVIPDGCFMNCKRLSSVEIPEGVTTIGVRAFFETNLETITLPSSVEEIGDAAFTYCNRLNTIDTQNNSRFDSTGHMLIDQKEHRLINCFGSKTEEMYGTEILVVPDGIETIGKKAFSEWGKYFILPDGNNYRVREVRFPESLKKIDQYAFEDLFGLEKIDLPDGLEEIGEFAFGSWNKSYDAERMKVKIGSNVNYIGYGSFSQFGNIDFQVDPNNLYYSSVDGWVTNLAGDTLLPVYGRQKELEARP